MRLHEQWIESNASISFATMKHLVVALITAFSFSVVLAEEVQYTTKYDNIDVDAVINSERLLNGYVGCLLDRTPCTPDAAELKSKFRAKSVFLLIFCKNLINLIL